MMSLSGVTVKNWTAENTPKRIRAIMERDDMTQQEFALLLGVSVSTVARWCGAKNKNVPDPRSRVMLQRVIERGRL